jgi:dihydrofolate reductase
MNHLTLDGVMQSPGRPDEDTRAGFTEGGWATATSDEALVGAMAQTMAAGFGGWLFGRRTYEDLLSHWTRQPDSPFGAALSDAPKYVASATLREPLPWPNSTLLGADAARAVAELKGRTDGILGIMGSGRLIEALLPHKLIDEFLLMIHPLVLGSGRRLFPDGSAPSTLRLIKTVASSKGVIIATYRAA